MNVLRFTVALVVTLVAAPPAARQQPGASSGDPSVSPYRLLRSTSGTNGEVRDGRFVILDPRTQFQLTNDSQIVVHLVWLGPTGPHRLSGTWRGPQGTSTTTEFDYTARERQFGAYWTLNLPATAPAGPWVLEARIDGHPAGAHEFEILPGSAAAPVATPQRVPLTRPELYDRGLAALVSVDALDGSGARVDSGLGVMLDDGRSVGPNWRSSVRLVCPRPA